MPYKCSAPFIDFLEAVNGKMRGGGSKWFEDGEGLMVDNRVYKDVGHRFSEEMVRDAVRWIGDVVGRERRGFEAVWLKQRGKEREGEVIEGGAKL